jgi:Fungal protein kinase
MKYDKVPLITRDAPQCTGCHNLYFILFYFSLANYLSLACLGHDDAVQAGVLHCDISAGNILIVDGRGILIDWDLSKWLNNLSVPDEARQLT